jgi:amino acid adenylation domain-containing protein
MDSIVSSVAQEEVLEGFRLSPQQRFVWSRGRSGTAVQGVIGVRGNLDRAAVEEAVRRVVERHEALRTRILGRAGVRMPLQVVLDSAGPFWDRIDLRVIAEEDLKERLAAVLREESGRLDEETFEGPSCRFVLAERSGSEHFLLVTLPALLADARSLASLITEISAAYDDPRSYERGSEEAVQYLQFSEWRNEIVAEEEAAAGARHWRAVEERCRPVHLPIAAEPGAEGGMPRGLATADLDRETCDLLRQAAARGPETSEDQLLAAWAGLLVRRAGEPGVTVVRMLDGRKFEDLEGVLGLLAGPVPLQVTVEESFRFTEVAERLGGAAREAYRWQEYFQPDASRFLQDFRTVAFSFQTWPAEVSAGGLEWSLLDRRMPDLPWQLDLACWARDGGLRLELRYDGALYRPEDAATLLSQWVALLGAGLAAPESSIRDLDGFGETGRRLLAELNGAPSDPAVGGTVQELFTRAASATPSAPAVVCEEAVLSYGELNALANRLAHRLRRLGVGPEARVGLCLDRSVELIAAMLGILKAGGAYVPLDPGLPMHRLASLLKEAGARFLVTRGPVAPELMAVGAEILNLAADSGAIAAEPASDPKVMCHPENLAYVLFTSGSTGQPKGVAVEHRQLLNYLSGIRDRLLLAPDASYAMVSSFAADLGNTALFPSLCQGGCLHLIANDRLSDPALLAEYCERHPIDCLKIVPSHLSALLEGAARPEAVLPRRLLVLGGEATGRELAAQIARLAPGLRVLNHYGPTETTVGVLTCPADHGSADSRLSTLPLGKPLANLRIAIVDERLVPVPVGMAGELLIGGAGVSRGYLGRPGLTAESFLPDPFSDRPGARLYRTGDRVRLLPSGALRFEGRFDHQVKIRGFRVELGEIEATLRLDAAVRDAVAVVREDEPGRPRLVAYLVPRRNAGLDAGRLRGLLRERLPEAMIPAALVFLEKLPLNANGKVDRRALPAPEAPGAEAGRRFVAPRTLGEEMLAGLWREVLGVDAVGVYDSFFELGGHSLLATQLISRVRKAFEVDLPLAAFFDQPTVAGLAVGIEQARQAGRTWAAPPLVPVGRVGEIPLSFAQERLWFMSQLEPTSAAYNVPRAVRLLGPLDIAVAGRAFDEIGRRHEVLRTTFVTGEGGASQVVAPAVDLTPAVVDLGSLPDAGREIEAARLAVAEARRPFDLARGPLARVILVRFSPREHIALMTLHHIVSDAWSTGVLIGELAELYAAFIVGRPPQIEALPVQYVDYAVWQRRWLTGEALDGELAFWRGRLAGAREEMLPTDFERPPQASFRGESLTCDLDADLVRALHELGRSEGTTLFMTLLAGFKALLNRHAGAEDVVVGTDVANRNRLEIERLIGFFVNNLVLRTDLGGDPTFDELLARVRRTTLEAFAHQELPFDHLVKALKPRRVPGRTPLFQVLFVLQNAPRKELQLADVTLQPFDLGGATSKFDVALFIAPEGGRLVTTWNYRSNLFSRATISRLAGRFETLLRSACRAPGTRLSGLEIDSADGRRERSEELQAREDERLARLRSMRRRGAPTV